HNHDGAAQDPNQEEVYVPLEGSGLLEAGDETFTLRPGMMARVGPNQLRRIVPGPDGIRFLALGGTPGVFTPGAWSELGALPPKQRAVLVLREALGWSAREVAAVLEDSVPAVNSALQRARKGLAGERADGGLIRAHASPGGEAESRVMRRFVEAWEAVDVQALIALLAGHALM